MKHLLAAIETNGRAMDSPVADIQNLSSARAAAIVGGDTPPAGGTTAPPSGGSTSIYGIVGALAQSYWATLPLSTQLQIVNGIARVATDYLVLESQNNPSQPYSFVEQFLVHHLHVG